MNAQIYEIPINNNEPIRNLSMSSTSSNYIDWHDQDLKYVYRLYK